jgi:hypothetical protein
MRMLMDVRVVNKTPEVLRCGKTGTGCFPRNRKCLVILVLAGCVPGEPLFVELNMKKSIPLLDHEIRHLVSTFSSHVMYSSVADRGSGAFLTLGSGMGKKSRSGSGMNIPDHISKSLETICWVKNS